MKRKRSHRGHRARRKLNTQSREGGRGRRLLRFRRQTDIAGTIIPLIDVDKTTDPPKKAA